MQLQGNNFSSIGQCARELYKTEGLRAFYVSYPTTLTMTVPFTAIQFATYEWAKKLLNPSEKYSPMSHALAGGFAGATAAALTTPLDVAKTLLQTRGCSPDAEIRNATSMIQAFKIIHQREGLRGFWRGLTPRIFTHMPSNALCWLVRIRLTDPVLRRLPLHAAGSRLRPLILSSIAPMQNIPVENRIRVCTLLSFPGCVCPRTYQKKKRSHRPMEKG